MKVVVYEPGYNEKHRAVLRALAAGIPGAIVRPVTEYEPCDVAVIFGGYKKAFAPTYSKRPILQRHTGHALLMVESAFVRRGEYYQVGWGGAAGHADFNVDERTPLDRWTAIAGDMVRPWRLKPHRPVIVCGQLPRDVQVQDVDHREWCRETVDYYVRRGVNVLFRPHPKMDSPTDYGVPRDLINADALETTLKTARAFVTWNSTSAVDAVIAGVPVVALNEGSIARPVASFDPDVLDYTPDRERWFAGLGYSQWTPDEMRKGLTWRHLTNG